MNQILGIAAAFVCLPFLTRIKKLGFGGALMITGLLMSLFAGIDFTTVKDSFLAVFTSPSLQNSMLAVIMIGMLGTILKHYGILEKIVRNLEVLIHNPKIILMILPAVLGMLPVPGGAMLSAPFVKDIGDKLHLPANRKTVINLSFRHVAAMFLVPFSSSMLLIDSILPEIGIYHLILLNIPLAVFYVMAAYQLFLRNVAYEPTSRQGSAAEAVKNLIINFFPIYSIVLINLIFGFPMWVSVLISVILTVFLCREKSTYLQTAWKGVNFNTLYMLIGVYFVQNLIKSQDGVMKLCADLFLASSGFGVLLVIMLIAVVLGLATGLNLVSLGILLPLIQMLPISVEEKLIYVFFVCVWSFIGYYYSPLHLCQILSNSYMGCSTGEATRENIKLMPVLAAASFILFYVYRWILL
ncbi:MAG: DUF401 family protein [Negativicutes bacterium]|nr:DUF401 family protein [Negativicutes bacterium]